MAISSMDFLSPKITLYYKGRNTHISQIGGLLSILLLILIIIIIFYILWDIISPELSSSFIYEINNSNDKISQTISYSGINHFIQIYTHTGNGWFGDLEKKNIIIYSIKENQNSFNNNLNINLTNTEHWLYDKCEKMSEIDQNLFSKISKTIPNYSKSICLRYYYNPNEKQYYEVGFDGFISPKLETNEIFEKKYVYKIIIEKCVNNSFINNMGYTCNNEYEIDKYLDMHTEIFTYFSNNQILPMNYEYPFDSYFYSVSSTIHKMSFFENNIIFSPIKLITDKKIFRHKREDLSYILNNNYQNKNYLSGNSKTIGIFNFYLNNNIIIYHRKYFNIMDDLSHLGGIAKVLFFIFQLINYINYRYTLLEHTKNLFHIGTGIDGNADGNETFFDKNHVTNHNFKIKVFNNNNIINSEDINHKLTKNFYERDNKKKSKYQQDPKNSSKKNIIFVPLNSKKYKNNYLSKRSRTRYLNTNHFTMGKQLTIKNKDKRKSYMSQGYQAASRYDNSVISKNQSIFENDLSNNEIISINDRNNINYSNIVVSKEGIIKNESIHRPSNEISPSKSNKKIKKQTGFKYTNQQKPSYDKSENITNMIMKNLESYKGGRHKSVNFTNQSRLLENNFASSLNNRFGLGMAGKNSSGFIDSSKQILVTNNKSPLIIHNNKIQYEKRYDDYSRIPTLINNDMFTNNITTALNNSNIDPTNFLKNIILNKIKFHMPEVKKNGTFFGNLENKIKYLDFVKSFLNVCRKKDENKNLSLINKFRNKLLSEEHFFRSFINLYLLEKIFQIDEPHKFEINELYNNL